MDVRIVGVDLPPRTWAPPRCGEVRRNVHVGVQRRAEVVELVPTDVREATWDLTVEVRPVDGTVDFRGPYVHGKRGERFLYLSWGQIDDAGTFQMFRRAKLMLGAIDPDLLHAASEPGRRLVGTVGLTGDDGGPRCAAVRPPGIEWSVTPV